MEGVLAAGPRCRIDAGRPQPCPEVGVEGEVELLPGGAAAAGVRRRGRGAWRRCLRGRRLESRWNSLHTGVDEAQTKLPSRPALAGSRNVDGSVVLFNRGASPEGSATPEGSNRRLVLGAHPLPASGFGPRRVFVQPRQSGAQWRPLGPFGGDVEDVNFSTTNASVMLAGVAPSGSSGIVAGGRSRFFYKPAAASCLPPLLRFLRARL